MASIELTFDWKETQQKKTRLVNWLQEANVAHMPSRKRSKILHVSKDKKLLDLNQKYELGEDFATHIERGKLYGFPRKTIENYANAVSNDENLFPNEKVVFAAMSDEVRGHYWYPYTEYLLRKGHEYEDSLIAKKWADLARKEIPEVAKEFEERTTKAMEDLRSNLLQNS